jgi:hypothetical protein
VTHSVTPQIFKESEKNCEGDSELQAQPRIKTKNGCPECKRAVKNSTLDLEDLRQKLSKSLRILRASWN